MKGLVCVVELSLYIVNCTLPKSTCALVCDAAKNRRSCANKYVAARNAFIISKTCMKNGNRTNMDKSVMIFKWRNETFA